MTAFNKRARVFKNSSLCVLWQKNKLAYVKSQIFPCVKVMNLERKYGNKTKLKAK